MAYVDARFHIAVRPKAEYVVPELGALASAALLGDASRDDACDALTSALASPPAHTREGDGDAAIVATPALAPLRESCARVCSHAGEYLDALASAWKAHVSETRRVVSIEVARRRNEMDEAVRVRAIYLERNPELVEREYRAEVARVSASLEAALDALRQRPAPAPQRCEELTRASSDLRNAFATAYGTAPTATLLALKRDFERELDAMQWRVLEAFCNHVARELRPPTRRSP